MTNSKEIQKIIAKAWKDPAFKKKLISNPRQTLQEMGITLPANVNIKVIEDQANTYTFVIPATPAKSEELSEKELSQMAGGFTDPPCMTPGKID